MLLRSLLWLAAAIGRAADFWMASLGRRTLLAKVARITTECERLRGENALLRARLSRIEPSRRPRYAPWERLRILLHRARYALSLEAAARAFLVSVQTLLNWKGDVERGVVRRVAARKPLNALPDLVREVAAFLKREWPAWGTRRIAGILARLGLRAPAVRVRRSESQIVQGEVRLSSRTQLLWLEPLTRGARAAREGPDESFRAPRGLKE